MFHTFSYQFICSLVCCLNVQSFPFKVHQSAVHAKGFRSLAEGEEVEYDISEDPKRGKKFAVNVTGPGGDFVKGAPRRDAGSRDFGGGNDF